MIFGATGFTAIDTDAVVPVPSEFVGVIVYVVALLEIVGVPEIWQFVVLKVRPVFVVRFGEIEQLVGALPVFVGTSVVMAVFCVYVSGPE